MLTIALGVGGITMMFGINNAVLLHPLPFPESDRIVLVWEVQPKRDLTRGGTTLADFLDWRDRNHVFEEMATWVPWSYNLTGQSEPEEVSGARVSTNFFDLFKVKPAVGRTFTPGEEQPGHEEVVMLSYRLWQRRFGSDSGLIGKTVTIDDKPYVVIGILPRAFSLWGTSQQYDLWMPLAFVRTQLVRDNHVFTVFGRLRRDATLSEANSEMSTIVRQLAVEYPTTDPDRRVSVVTMQEDRTERLRAAIELLFGAAAFVFLIALVNVANLILSRAAVRLKEIAIRASLGAGKLRLIQQLTTENMLVALLGGAAGLLLAAVGLAVLPAVLSALGESTHIPYGDRLTVDFTVLGFTLLVSVLAGAFFGLAPTIQLFSPSLTRALKEGGTAARAGRRFQNLVVIFEVSLSFVLLLSALLLIRSFATLIAQDPGFNPKGLLTLRVRLPLYRYREGRQITTFFQQLMENIHALPGIRGAGMINLLPLTGWSAFSDFDIEGRAQERPGEEFNAQFRIVDWNYFRTMGIPLRRGRELTSGDRDGALAVVLINETLARRYWPSDDPVGKHIRLRFSAAATGPWTPQLQQSWLAIAGIVGDANEWRYGEKKVGMMYLPYLQNPSPFMTLVLRTDSDPMTLIPAVTDAVRSSDKDQPITAVKPMDQYVEEMASRPRFSQYLVGLLAMLATVLAAIGIYGVMSYSVNRQTREIGIRLALGAQRWDVLRLIVGRAMGLVLIGIGLGLVVELAVLPRVIASFLYGVTPHDLASLLGAGSLLVCVAFGACYLPARRATKIDPLSALRYE
jgi:putative ABC transport system permease protein